MKLSHYISTAKETMLFSMQQVVKSESEPQPQVIPSPSMAESLPTPSQVQLDGVSFQLQPDGHQMLHVVELEAFYKLKDMFIIQQEI